VPNWVPSVDSIQLAFKASVENVKSNLTAAGKNKKEAAMEVLLVLLQVVFVLLILLGLPGAPPPWFIAQILGVVLFLLGAFFFVAATATMGTKLTFLPTPTAGMTLVDQNVYQHCRHPQYFGMIAFGLGLSLVSLSCNRLLWTVLLWLVLEKKADIEELCLAEEFPDTYPAYAMVRPKFIPGRIITGAPEYQSFDTETADDKIAE